MAHAPCRLLHQTFCLISGENYFEVAGAGLFLKMRDVLDTTVALSVAF